MSNLLDELDTIDFADADKILAEELAKEDKEASKLLCKFKVKDEVKLTIKGKMPKQLLKVTNMTKGKLGRVIQVVDKDTVLVDFWDTKPTKVQLKTDLLTLDTPAEEIAKLSAHYVHDNGVQVTLSDDSQISLDEHNVTFYSTKDRVTFPDLDSNTAIKYDSGKERVDLINPNFILEIGRVLGYGANKYPTSDYNYLEGQGLDYSRVYASLQRHILKWYSGEQIDPESGIPHLIHAAANLQFLFNYDTMSKGKDDRRFK